MGDVNMFLCKFFLENNSSNYVFEDNNQLFGFSIDKNGIDELQYEVLNTIKKNLFMNSRCQKVLEHNGYDVYFDYFTGYKHFIKDGKENIELFFENNGVDALVYYDNSVENNSMKNNNPKRFKSKLFKIGATTLICTLLGCKLLPETLQVVDYVHYNNSSIQQIMPIDEDYVVDLITKYISESPNLSDEDKTLFINSGLLELVSPYYGDIFNEKLQLCFKNLEIKYVPVSEASKFSIFDNKLTMGYYDRLDPNVINISVEGDSNFYNVRFAMSSVKIHEFVHLLQSEHEYDFIVEGVATILSKEVCGFYDEKVSVYTDNLYLLKILMEIIGTEPILRFSFGNDPTMLKSVLTQNLSYDEYNNFLELLRKSPEDISMEEKNKMYDIMKTLYKNINGHDISLNTNLLVDYLYDPNFSSFATYYHKNMKNFFLKPEYDDFVFYIDLNHHDEMKDRLIKDGIITAKQKWLIGKELSYDEYLNTDELDEIFIVTDDGKTILIENGYVSEECKSKLDSKEYTLYNSRYINCGDEIEDGYTFIKEDMVYESLIPNVSVNHGMVQVSVSNTLDRFPKINVDNDSKIR